MVLGSACADIQTTPIRDRPEDDDREFFVVAWCWHPSFIPPERLIFIPELLQQAGRVGEDQALRSLRYLVRIRVVAYQDWTTPPGSPVVHNDGNNPDDEEGDEGEGDAAPDGDVDDGQIQDGPDDYWPTPRRDSSGSPDSNYNNYHPTGDYPLSDSSLRPAVIPCVQVGAISCKLDRVPQVPGAPWIPDSTPHLEEGRLSHQPPCTPRKTRSPRTLICKMPSPWVSRETSVGKLGLVGRCLVIDPPLLQGGRGTQLPSPPTPSEDWWVACAEIELQRMPTMQVSVGVQVPNVFEGPVADLVEGGISPSSQGALPMSVGAVQVSPAVVGSVSTQPSSALVTTAANMQERIEDAVCCPLVSPIIRAGPHLRRSKTPVLVHSLRRSGRLASKSRASNASSQA